MRVSAYITTEHLSYEIERIGAAEPFIYLARVTSAGGYPRKDAIQIKPTTLPEALEAVARHLDHSEKTVSAVVTALFPAGGAR